MSFIVKENVIKPAQPAKQFYGVHVKYNTYWAYVGTFGPCPLSLRGLRGMS